MANPIVVTDWGSVISGSEVITDFGNVVLVDVTTPTDGNPGSNVRVETVLSDFGTFTERFIPIAGATYTPSVQGAVGSFDFSIDQIRESDDGHGWGIGFKQDGILQFLNVFNLYAPTNQPVYTTYADSGVLAGDLQGIGFPSGLIDFTSTGSLIQVGLIIFQGNGCCNPFSNDVTRYDNLFLQFNPIDVPAPGALAILSLGLLGLGLRRRIL